jgi:uncharacterized protein
VTIEITPSGVSCNLSCTYCYQHPLRDAGNFTVPYDFEKVKKAYLENYKGADFALFGGEVLLTPKPVLEQLLEFGLEQNGKNGIQTNGVLIDDDHIEMFKKYKVHVGFSFDGEDELNDLRWSGTLEKTREDTKRTLNNVAKCIQNGIGVSAILTLHAVNVGTDERLQKFKFFLKKIDKMGVSSIRIHDLEVDTDLTARKHVLTPERNKEVFLELAEFSKEIQSLQIDVFDDIRSLLESKDRAVTCIFRGCDPYTTNAVQEINGDGTISNCGRVSGVEGMPWRKAKQEGYERYISLYQTPWEYGGCKDCRFFLLCKGNCPGGALVDDYGDRDWRNRTQSCEMWYGLFEHFEKIIESEGKVPFSKRPDRKIIEEKIFEWWNEGKNKDIEDAIEHLQYNYDTELALPVVQERGLNEIN